MNSRWLVIIIVFGLSLSCCKDKKAEVAESLFYKDRNAGEYQDKLRVPIDIHGNIDTSNAPKIEFLESSYNFGEISEGAIINHRFSFKNSGTKPLYILDTKTSCGCTVPSFEEKAVLPGEHGEINVQFKSEGRTGRQEKNITIYSNTYPNQSKLKLTGTIISKK